MDSILLVEDKSELREMLATALQRMGYAVLPAANSTEALIAVARQGVSPPFSPISNFPTAPAWTFSPLPSKLTPAFPSSS